MDVSIVQFIQKYKDELNPVINSSAIRHTITTKLPTLSHALETNADFYDELVKQNDDSFFIFLEALKEGGCKIEAEWIENKLSSFLYHRNKLNTGGLCLIINNVEFEKSDDSNSSRVLGNRNVSIKDEKALEEVFKKIGCQVFVARNLTARDMMEEVEEFCSLSDIKEYPFFTIFVLTHGDSSKNQDILYGIDGKPVYKYKIIEELNKNDYKNMVGKPKFVFFQACRGKKIYNRIESDDRDPDSIPLAVAEAGIDIILPKVSNTTIVHSALPGYKCHRLKKKGSVFCQTLANVLMRDYKTHNLYEMLVTINKEIRDNFPGEEEFIHIEHMGVTERIYGRINLRDELLNKTLTIDSPQRG